MVDESTLATLVEGLLRAPPSEQGPLHELLSLAGETDGFPPSSFDILAEGNKATDSLLAPFSPPPATPYPGKGSVVGKDGPDELSKSVVEAIFRSVPQQSAEREPTEHHRPTQTRPVEAIDIDAYADESFHPAVSHGAGIRGASQVDPGNGRRNYQQQASHRPLSRGSGISSRPSSYASSAPVNEVPQREAPKGPFRTAQSKYVQDKRKRGGRSPLNKSRRDGGSGHTYRYGNNQSHAHKDNSTHIRGPDANIRAMTKAVLGKRQRPSAGESTRKESSGPSEDLPEIPNVDPKFVEMIMNEMLEKSPGVEWDDIAGLAFAKRCVMEAIVWPMLRPDIFTGLRSPPKGLLLFGPPGTGKTMIGRAIASKSGARFFNISASSLMSKWVGEGEKMVRALFAVAREFQPSVIFIDEIDSLLTQRTESDQESSRRIKTEFLVQMDGAGTDREDRVLLVGATNRPQELDEAARRRLIKRLYIPLPDDEARRAMVKRLLDKSKNAVGEGDFDEIVALSNGYSGSDMYALSAEAALGPVRDLGEAIGNISEAGVRPIGKDDFVDAAKQVRASVSGRDLDGYVEWNKTFGSFPTDPSISGAESKT